jgi:hypothetical protein
MGAAAVLDTAADTPPIKKSIMKPVKSLDFSAIVVHGVKESSQEDDDSKRRMGQKVSDMVMDMLLIVMIIYNSE